MINADNFRTSKDFKEILRILQKASSESENLVWQSHDLGRNIIPVHHAEIDFVAREVVLYFNTQKYQLSTSLPLYIKLDYRMSVFKVKDFQVKANCVHFPFPTEVKTLELRALPRFTFLPQQDKTISLRPTLTGSRDSGNELHIRAFDVSRHGLGLIISEQNRPFLKNNRILWVTRLGEEILHTPVLAEVVYMNSELDSRYLVRKQKELKVGIKLSSALPVDLYDKFIQ